MVWGVTREKVLIFLRSYLGSRAGFGGLFLLFYVILGLFSYLFEESREELGYLLLLLSCLGLVFFLLDGLQAFKTYRLFLLYGEIHAKTPLEVLLLSQLEEEKGEKEGLVLEQQARASELLDYYTLWVHQIKTPIAASQLLSQNVAEPALKAQLEQELFKIDSYTNLVLQYLRLESFHEDLVVEQENLEDLVKEVVKKYAIFFIRKNLTLSLHDLEGKVVTDKKWLLVLLEQILSNSLKYTSQGGIEIYLEEGILYIKDTGIGIQDSDMLRVFERGFSGYNGRLTQQSSGLGLYLSKKIADKLGHDLYLTSQLGQGTTVCIDFKERKLSFD